MTDHRIRATDFDLRMTLESGQVFHWLPDGDGWVGLIGNCEVRAEQRGESLMIRGTTPDVAARYFALDHPLRTIYRRFPKDSFSLAARKACAGTRIIRQPHWECLATFITSSMKQVAHIRQMSFAIRERWGDRVQGSRFRMYPKPERLAGATEAGLRACGLGFRAKNLLGAAQWIADGRMDLDAVAKLPTPAARDVLCRLPGVGKKVANCALLFAFERLDVVPIDVWIGRVLRAMHGGSKLTAAELDAFCADRFGDYAGYVQQYLFHYARISKTLPGQ